MLFYLFSVSKFYLLIKIQYNAHVLKEASLNSSCNYYSFLFDPYHFAGSNLFSLLCVLGDLWEVFLEWVS